MSVQLPRVLKNMNFYPDGRSYAGRFDTITPPALALVLEEHRAAGMDLPIDLDMGMEKLTMTGVLNDKDPEIMKLFGKPNIQFLLKGSVQAQGQRSEPVLITMRGMVTRLEQGEWKPGTKTADTVSFSLTYFKYRQRDVEHIEIDALNMIRRIGDEDPLADIRADIGL